MPTMQFFYDYECPFCKLGYGYLLEFIGARPDIEIEWLPIEAHPRPETHPPHTDLCVRAYYIARELEADMPRFHAAMFQAIATERRDAEDIDILAGIVADIVDPAPFRAALKSGGYAGRPDANNDLAYEHSGVWAVPAFRMDGKRLDAAEGIGVSREQVRDFLAQ